METQEPGGIRGLGNDVMKYAGLRANEIKLKASKTLSDVLSRFLSYFLLIVILGIVMGLAAYAVLQWLNGMLGAPWGTLIVFALFLALFIVLWCCRKVLFKEIFLGLLTDIPIEELDSEIASCEKQSLDMEYRIGSDVNGLRKAVSPLHTLGHLLKNKNVLINLVSMLVTIISIIRKGKKKCTNSHQS